MNTTEPLVGGYRHAGLDFRLAGVEHAQVVKGVPA